MKRKTKLSHDSWRGRLLWGLIVLFTVTLCLVSQLTGFTDRLLSWTGVSGKRQLPSEGEIQVHVLDVGNADAIVLFCDNRAVLIDAGEYNDGKRITEFLETYDVAHLDFVLATHPDADHIGGMQEVLSHVTVGEYITAPTPNNEEPSQTQSDLLQFLAAHHVTVTEAECTTVRRFGSAELRVLSASNRFDTTNDRSLVCRVDYQQNRFLFTGDAGYEVESALSAELVDADFLKVSHHGGDGATSATFLEKVTPSVAVISCGAGNAYDHPHGAVLGRLRAADATVYRTDRMGTVTVIGNGTTLSVHTEKE